MNPTACRFAALLAAAALSPAPLVAQGHDHGPADQLGRVSFPVSCNAEAQRRFERAMALLHSFWWEQGLAAFRGVADADSTCAMAYWGLALNTWGNPFAGGASGDNLRQGAYSTPAVRSTPKRGRAGPAPRPALRSIPA